MGYGVKRFISKVPDVVICSICRNVCEDAVECPEEHLFCKNCLANWLLDHDKCPVDSSEQSKTLKRDDVKPASRSVKQYIGSFQIKCVNYEEGCDHISIVEYEAVHSAQCKFNSGPSLDSSSKNVKAAAAVGARLKNLEKHREANDTSISMLKMNVAAITDLNKTATKELDGLVKELRSQLTSFKKSCKSQCSQAVMGIVEASNNEEHCARETDLRSKLTDAEVRLKTAINQFVQLRCELDGYTANLHKVDSKDTKFKGKPPSTQKSNGIDQENHRRANTVEVKNQPKHVDAESDLTLVDFLRLEAALENYREKNSDSRKETLSMALKKTSIERVRQSKLFPEKRTIILTLYNYFAQKGLMDTLKEEKNVSESTGLSGSNGVEGGDGKSRGYTKNSFFTLSDYGRDPPVASDEHRKVINNFAKENLFEFPCLRSLMSLMEFSFHGSAAPYENYGRKMCIKLNHISRVASRGMKVLLICSDSYLAVAVTIILGEKGRLFCYNSGKKFIEGGGFAHLLEAKRINLINDSPGLMRAGHPTEAPYDLILIPTDKFNRAHQAQLVSGGRAYDFNEGKEIVKF